MAHHHHSCDSGRGKRTCHQLSAINLFVLLFLSRVGLKRGSETPSKKRAPQQNPPPPPTVLPTDTDSNSNAISPVPSEDGEEVLEHGQSESYHWCEEDEDLTSSEAATTSTEKTLASSADADHHSAEEYVELAKEADTNLAHIDMEDFKSADLFQSEQIRSLLIEYRQRNNRPLSRSQSPLSQVLFPLIIEPSFRSIATSTALSTRPKWRPRPKRWALNFCFSL